MTAKKKIMLLGAGAEQCLAIHEAKELGYHVICCDENPSAPGLKISDEALVLDITDVNSLVSIGRNRSIDGIFCHGVEIPLTVSSVAEELGLVGLKSSIAYRCTNKIARIEALKGADIQVADFAVAESREELVECSETFGFPLVLKPIDNAGSRGVQLVNGTDSLLSAYDEAIKYSRSQSVLLEKFMIGDQISTESIVYRGEIHTFAFADRNYSHEELYAPFFIEDGINFPAKLSPKIQDDVLDLVKKTIMTLGIDIGAAKGDIIVHDGVPHIIEMASRTSGGWFGAGSIPLATGVNPLRPLLQMFMGEEPDLTLLQPTRNLGCAQRYWIPTDSFAFQAAHGLNDVLQMPGVKMFDAFFPPKGTNIEKARHHAQRYAQVICTADTRDEAIRYAEDAIAAIQVQRM